MSPCTAVQLGTLVLISVNASPNHWCKGTDEWWVKGIFLNVSLSADATKICLELQTSISRHLSLISCILSLVSHLSSLVSRLWSLVSGLASLASRFSFLISRLFYAELFYDAFEKDDVWCKTAMTREFFVQIHCCDSSIKQQYAAMRDASTKLRSVPSSGRLKPWEVPEEVCITGETGDCETVPSLHMVLQADCTWRPWGD